MTNETGDRINALLVGAFCDHCAHAEVERLTAQNARLRKRLRKMEDECATLWAHCRME